MIDKFDIRPPPLPTKKNGRNDKITASAVSCH